AHYQNGGLVKTGHGQLHKGSGGQEKTALIIACGGQTPAGAESRARYSSRTQNSSWRRTALRKNSSSPVVGQRRPASTRWIVLRKRFFSGRGTCKSCGMASAMALPRRVSALSVGLHKRSAGKGSMAGGRATPQ